VAQLAGLPGGLRAEAFPLNIGPEPPARDPLPFDLDAGLMCGRQQLIGPRIGGFVTREPYSRSSFPRTVSPDPRLIDSLIYASRYQCCRKT
jgi:hypothetical protein